MFSKPIQVCRRLLLYVVFVSFIPQQSVNAQGPGSYNAGTLLFSPSAVANGVGGGLVAASVEASAMHYNPAALSHLGKVALEGNTFELFSGFDESPRYKYLAGALGIGAQRKWWVGAAYMRTGFGKQIITDENSPEPLGEYEPYEKAVTLAIATKFNQHARFGVGVKWVRIDFGPVLVGDDRRIDANAFAVDLGFLYDGFLPATHFSKLFLSKPTPWHKWTHQGLPPGFSFGVALANVGTKANFGVAAQADPLPQNLRIGLAWNIFESDLLGLIATGEFSKILVRVNRNGQSDGALQALFSAWGDKSLRDEFSEAVYSGGVEVSLLRLAALRWGRNWNGDSHFGYNTFGYSLGPTGLRFAFAKYRPFEFFAGDEWRVYTVAIVLDKLF